MIFYEDHIANGEDVNPRDYPMIAWEINPNYMDPNSVDDWTPETLEQIFGNKVDDGNPNGAPYRVEVMEWFNNFKHGEAIRFFTPQITSQRALAEALGVPLYVTYIMNAFDQYVTTTSAGYETGTDDTADNYNNEVGALQFLDRTQDADTRGWLSRGEAMGTLRAWNDVPLFLPFNGDTYTMDEIKGAFDSAIYMYGMSIHYEDAPSDLFTVSNLPTEFSSALTNPTDMSQNAVDILASLKSVIMNPSVDQANLKRLYDGFVSAMNYEGQPLVVPDNANPFVDDSGAPRTPTNGEVANFIMKLLRGYVYSFANANMVPIAEMKDFARNNRTRIIGPRTYMTKAELESVIDGLTSFDDMDKQAWRLMMGYRDPSTGGQAFDVPSETDQKPSDWGLDGVQYTLNPAATNREGEQIAGNTELEDALHAWLEGTLVSSSQQSISGVESLSRGVDFSQIPNMGNVYDAYENRQPNADYTRFNQLLGSSRSPLRQWFSNPRLGEPSALQSVFSDYAYNFAEVMTRDWVQMTYAQDQYDTGEGAFRYQSDIAPVDEMNTGISRYLDPSNFVDDELASYFSYEKTTDTTYTTGVTLRRFNFVNNLLTNPEITSMPGYQEVILDKANESSGSSWFDQVSLWNLIKGLTADSDVAKHMTISSWSQTTSQLYLGGPYNNFNRVRSTRDILFTPSITDNGWNTDRWLRSSLSDESQSGSVRDNEGTEDSWVLYDNDGAPIHDDTRIVDFATGATATDRVRAYWSFFMESRGVGLRTLSAAWRVPDRDAFALWGYFRNEWVDVVKHLTFTNRETGETKNFDVTTGVDNLFYYEHQGDRSTRHTLEQDGYTSWTVDYLSMGTWFDSSVPNGEWTVTFTDENGNALMQNDEGRQDQEHGTSLFNIGDKEHITENGFDPTFAPVDFMTDDEGHTYARVRDQFPI